MTFYPEDDHNPCGGRRRARAHNLAIAVLVLRATVPETTAPCITNRDTLRGLIQRARAITPSNWKGDRRATGDACNILGMVEPHRRVTINAENEARCTSYLRTESTQEQLITFHGAAEQSFSPEVQLADGEPFVRIPCKFRIQDAVPGWAGESALCGYVTSRVHGQHRTTGFIHGRRTVYMHQSGYLLDNRIVDHMQRLVEAAIRHHQSTYSKTHPGGVVLTRGNAAHISKLLISPFVRRPCMRRMREGVVRQHACIVNLPLITAHADRMQAFRVRDEYIRWTNEFVTAHGLNAVLFKEMVRTRFGVPDLRPSTRRSTL